MDVKGEREAAYHEAGHAIVAIRCGRKLESVWINEHGGGNSRHYDPLYHKYGKLRDVELSGDDLQTHGQSLIIMLAGPYAQRRFVGDPHTPIASSDQGDIRE
jgi:hypothetical protein